VEVKARVLYKRELRKSLRQRFAALSDRESLQEKLVARLAKFLKDSDGVWAMYKAIPGEISLNTLPEKAPHIQWAYPKVTGDALQFYIPGNQGFSEGYAGISEPVVAGATRVTLDDLTGILVPALGFDRSGVRLGKGQGHYDRTLADFSGCKVGVSFSDLIEEQISEDSWDVRMDFLATEIAVEAVN
jgi:5-formyltetrahydrofolate cyclo-ligase